MWYNGVLKSSSTNRPVIFLDILPFRDELMASLQLSQQVIHGSKYALRKWMAHARTTLNPQTYRPPRSDLTTETHWIKQVQTVHRAWYGQLVLEMDGTSEVLHDFIVRTAGPTMHPDQSRALLKSVLDPHSRSVDRALPPLHLPTERGQIAPYVFPFQLLRERCQPGLVVVQPIAVAFRP